MPTLHLYNLNYKIPVKHLKNDLFDLISRFTKKIRIKFNRKYPGECWIEVENQKSSQKILETLSNFYFFDRPLKIESSQKPMLASRNKIILIKNVEPAIVLKLKETYQQCDIRYIEVKKVVFIEGENLEKLMKSLKNDKTLTNLQIEFGK